MKNEPFLDEFLIMISHSYVSLPRGIFTFSCSLLTGAIITYNCNVGPPFTIAKLVNITPKTVVFDTQTAIAFMGFINNKHNWQAPHCIYDCQCGVNRLPHFEPHQKSQAMVDFKMATHQKLHCGLEISATVRPKSPWMFLVGPQMDP